MTSTAAARIRSTESGILKEGEYGYPLGHLGHLTDAQQKALAEFKELCAEKGLYKPAVDGRPSSHDDIVMLRFLRARRFVAKDALEQFKDTELWREANEIDNLYMNIDVDHFEETRALYPQWTGRRDKRGLPVYVFQVAPLNSKTMSAYAKSATSTAVLNAKKVHNEKDPATIPPRMYRLFALYENLTNFTLPFCSYLKDRPSAETPISQSNNIVDISGVGLKQFWNLRTHMQEASVLATAHYPETLDRIFIVGAPSFFPTVWGWIKRWFDPITTSKIFILSEHNAYRTLSTFIEPENIPIQYGGKLAFKFGDAPVLEPKLLAAIQWDLPTGASWPKGPVQWVPKDDGSLVLMAVGSVKGKERRQPVAYFRPDIVEADYAAAQAHDLAQQKTQELVAATEKMGLSANGNDNNAAVNPPLPPPAEEAAAPVAATEKVPIPPPEKSEVQAVDEAEQTASVPAEAEKVGVVPPQAAVAAALPEPSGKEVEQLAN